MTSIIYKGKPASGGIPPQTINIPYVANGEYKGVFYQIGTKIETVAYYNPSLSLNAYTVSFSFGSLLLDILPPHLLLNRPANFSDFRNCYHSAISETQFVVSLPSGFRLKPTGIALQSRSDGGTLNHVGSFDLIGCNTTLATAGNTASIGSFTTGFSDGNSGQWFVNNSISTSNYYTSFIFKKTAGNYITGGFFELFGELKIYS